MDSLTKICSKCGNEKPLSEFNKSTRNTDGYRGFCKECGKANSKRWHKNNPERSKELEIKYIEQNREHKLLYIKKYKMMEKYGLEWEAYQAMLVAQSNKCDICEKELPKIKHIDHCHTTGKVRAILCKSCNTGIGKFRDDPALLRRAATYVEGYRNMTDTCEAPLKCEGQ